MSDVVYLIGIFLGSSPMATIATVFIFDVPRDIVALMAIGLSRVSKKSERRKMPFETVDVTVVIPAYNDAEGVLVTLRSLEGQLAPPRRVIVVSDASTDYTTPVITALRDEGRIDDVIVNHRRMGRATAGNIALQYVETEFILFIDCDTRLDPCAIAALHQRMRDRPETAACSGNIAVDNDRASLWTGLQQLEYMVALDFGRELSDGLGAMACCSGALTMHRSSVLRRIGGMASGSGEDLATTLRLRRAGYEVHFEADAWAYTNAPRSLRSLINQRLRWDRDAFRIQILQYHQMAKQDASEPLRDTLQRYDYLLFTLLPTLMLPLFLPILSRIPAGLLPQFILGGYLFLVALAAVTLAPVFIAYRGRISIFIPMLLPVYPIYQGILMKAIRLYAYISEAAWHASVHDGYLPERIRNKLNGRH